MKAMEYTDHVPTFTPEVMSLEQATLDRAGQALETTHAAMAQQIARLTAELEAARLARREEHAERGHLLTRLASLLDALPGGVVIVDSTGKITESNPQAERLLGEPLEGEDWSAVEARGYYPDETTLEIHGRRLSIEATHLGENGETVVLISDITRHHTLQDEASRKQRLVALGEMAARLAHQIRTPLSSTLLYLTLLESDLPKDQRQNICGDVRSHLQHMEALITSMLGFVKGQGNVTGQVGIEAVLQDAVQSCTADIEHRHATVIVDSCGPAPHLEGCHDDLVAAFSNLITNAIDASNSEPNITIKSRIRNNRLAVIQIADRGCGIPADAIDRIFDPFFTTRAAGNGLGLAVVAGTVTQHGGTIRAVNRPGGGAEFTVLLPITPVSEAQAEVV